MITGKEKAKTRIHSAWFIAAIPKILEKIGTYTIMTWRPMDHVMARRRYGLTNGDMVNRELSSEMAFKALSISMTTRTESERVEALTFPVVK